MQVHLLVRTSSVSLRLVVACCSLRQQSASELSTGAPKSRLQPQVVRAASSSSSSPPFPFPPHDPPSFRQPRSFLHLPSRSSSPLASSSTSSPRRARPRRSVGDNRQRIWSPIRNSTRQRSQERRLNLLSDTCLLWCHIWCVLHALASFTPPAHGVQFKTHGTVQMAMPHCSCSWIWTVILPVPLDCWWMVS